MEVWVKNIKTGQAVGISGMPALLFHQMEFLFAKENVTTMDMRVTVA